jgi:hypothetical protein
MVNKVNELKITELKGTGARIGQHKIKQRKFEGNFTREQIRSYVQSFSDKLRDKGIKGSIGVALRYPQFIRGTEYSNVGDPIRLYNSEDHYQDGDVEEPDVFKSFTVYYTSKSV